MNVLNKDQRKPKSAPSRPAAIISPARNAAAQILLAVWQRKGHSDDLLHGRAMAGLSSEDRNLATALVLGTLRWQIALDARIQPFLSRPDVLPPQVVLLALRLGAFQLLHMDRIPVHAAINESVELSRAYGQSQATGLVNAVLRKIHSAERPRKPLHESTANLASRLGHPAWLAERWVNEHGRKAATAICEFDQQEPSCGTLFTATDDAGIPVMDDGSRLVAEIAAASMPEAKRIWDCCAAPGGKTLILAKRHPEAEILATDASPSRLRILAERLQREAPNADVKTAIADATKPEAVEGSFDLVLCDVPCSGTGTLARNPEIRHNLQAGDFARHAERQRAILLNGLQHLAPGGRLIYSTCSLEAEECEQVVSSVLAEATGVARAPIEEPLAELRGNGSISEEFDSGRCVQNGALRTLPGYNMQADGFFAVVLSRS